MTTTANAPLMPEAKVRWLSVVALVMLILPGFASTASYAQAGSRYFPETGKTVKGRFLEYWTQHGGLAQQGYPISDEMQERSDTDGKTYTVQYFERAVFEYHPENRPPNDVLLSLLGVFLYKQKYLSAAPGQTPNTSPGSVLFPQTGKRLGGVFLQYWRTHGGLAQQGYPISDEFQEKSDLDGKIYRVQYFERAVFEYHPENAGTPYEVLLSQLGTFRYRAKYQQTPVAEVNINIVDFRFDPAEVTVKVGTRVTWTEVGPTVHNTVSRDKLWESPILNPGQKFSYTFTRPGTYEYLCTLHPEMVGKVIVK